MQHAMHSGSSSMDAKAGKSHYRMLLIMTVVSFIAMYVLMYAMVNEVRNAHFNLNQVYMAGLMTAAMVVIELGLMRSMYQHRKLNAAILAAGAAALLLFWFVIRQQGAIGDRQFMHSMIPHHASAILMCQQATITDAEVKRICGAIVSSQQAEIDQMNAILRRTR